MSRVFHDWCYGRTNCSVTFTLGIVDLFITFITTTGVTATCIYAVVHTFILEAITFIYICKKKYFNSLCCTRKWFRFKIITASSEYKPIDSPLLFRPPANMRLYKPSSIVPFKSCKWMQFPVLIEADSIKPKYSLTSVFGFLFFASLS